ncbi:MAG: hypothetical protein GWP61_04480 [Chloroflexi bacterium]|jgi:hypothetical protein|nr:hypothetical protein [Chloroflexota bacterium]
MIFKKIPKRMQVVLLVFVAVAVGGCSMLEPQFSHQGRLLDENGTPVPDADYEVEYRLFQQQIGGTAVYSETNTIAVENGLFTASIGPSQDLPAELFSRPMWMEIGINGETLTPRQRLEGAPFAFSLAPGAVVRGFQARERTFNEYEDTGATLTVWNEDGAETGGQGLLVINQAAPTGDEREKVAAVMAISAGGTIDQGYPGADSGAYGAIFRSEAYRGMYARGGRDGGTEYFAGVFDSGAGILITGGGGCFGCALAYPARNAGDVNIQPGDFVAATGVQLDPELNIPVMEVQKAGVSSDVVVGVAIGAMDRSPVGDFYGATTGGFEESSGTALADDYLSVVYQGLVQANVGQRSGLKIGDYLGVDADRVTAVTASQASAGRLMSEVGKDGLAWVMVGGR